MSELIDREATVKQICKIGEMLGVSHDRDVTIAVALFVQDDKSAFPTIERPHGEWIFKHNSADIWCSNCDENFDEIPQKFLFCPNCGAYMSDKKDDLAEIIEAAQSMKDSDEEKKSCLNCGTIECELGNRARYGFCGNWTMRGR